MMVIPTMAGVQAQGSGGIPSFIGTSSASTVGTGSYAIPWPIGTVADSLGFYYYYSNLGGAGAPSTSGWSSASLGLGTVYWKILVAADLTATITTDGSFNTVTTYVFGGFSLGTVGTNQNVTVNDGSTSRSWSGFTKSVSARGLFFLMQVQPAAIDPTITAPVMASALYTGPRAGFYPTRGLYNFTASEYPNLDPISETYGPGWDVISLAVFNLL